MTPASRWTLTKWIRVVTPDGALQQAATHASAPMGAESACAHGKPFRRLKSRPGPKSGPHRAHTFPTAWCPSQRYCQGEAEHKVGGVRVIRLVASRLMGASLSLLHAYAPNIAKHRGWPLNKQFVAHAIAQTCFKSDTLNTSQYLAHVDLSLVGPLEKDDRRGHSLSLSYPQQSCGSALQSLIARPCLRAAILLPSAAAMVSNRKKYGTAPRARFRPDGTRRRTKNELAKRARRRAEQADQDPVEEAEDSAPDWGADDEDADGASGSQREDNPHAAARELAAADRQHSPEEPPHAQRGGHHDVSRSREASWAGSPISHPAIDEASDPASPAMSGGRSRRPPSPPRPRRRHRSRSRHSSSQARRRSPHRPHHSGGRQALYIRRRGRRDDSRGRGRSPAPRHGPGPTSGSRRHRSPPRRSRSEQIGRAMSYVLRHQVGIRPDGFLHVDAIMGAEAIRRLATTVAEIRDATSRGKQRFEWQRFGSGLHARARQGHSLDNIDPGYQPIGPEEGAAMRLYRATHEGYLKSIQIHGLLPGGPDGSRKHVHFATAPIRGAGLRDREAVLLCNAAELLEHGITLLKASNGVVLTPDVVPPRFITRIEKGSAARISCVNACLSATEHMAGSCMRSEVSQVGPSREPLESISCSVGPALRVSAREGHIAMKHAASLMPYVIALTSTGHDQPDVLCVNSHQSAWLIIADSRVLTSHCLIPTALAEHTSLCPDCNRYWAATPDCAAQRCSAGPSKLSPLLASAWDWLPCIVHVCPQLTSEQHWFAGLSRICSEWKGGKIDSYGAGYMHIRPDSHQASRSHTVFCHCARVSTWIDELGDELLGLCAIAGCTSYWGASRHLIAYHAVSLPISVTALYPTTSIAVLVCRFGGMEPSRRQLEGTAPRSHYRPDGSRRRTAGELAARAARAKAPSTGEPTAKAPAPASPGVPKAAPAGVPKASTQQTGATFLAPKPKAQSAWIDGTGVTTHTPDGTVTRSKSRITWRPRVELSAPSGSRSSQQQPSAPERSREVATSPTPSMTPVEAKLLCLVECLETMANLGAANAMADCQRQGSLTQKHTLFHTTATHGVPPVGRWVLAAAAAMCCAEMRQVYHGASHGKCGDFFEAFLQDRPLYREPATKLLVTLTELLSLVHPRTFEAIAWRQSPRELEKQHTAPVLGEAGDPALRDLIMTDVEEPTSTATLPAPTREPPSSEETAPSATPGTFVRTVTSFRDPAGWLPPRCNG